MFRKRIRDLPRHLKPRERLIHHGPRYLTDEELYAILIGSGNRERDVRSIAGDVARRLGGEQAGYESLLAIKGLGPAGACRVLAAGELARRRADAGNAAPILKQPEDVYRHLQPISRKQKEYLIGLYLDPGRRLLEEVTLAIGSIHALAIEPYDILHPAVLKYSPQFILAHNHPSGDPTPSAADRKLTREIGAAAAILGIEMLDHIIIAADAWYSFSTKRTSRAERRDRPSLTPANPVEKEELCPQDT